METTTKRAKTEPVETPAIKLKDPYWVGRDVEGKFRFVKEARVSIHRPKCKYVYLRMQDDDRYSISCREIGGKFHGWSYQDYPVTLEQEGNRAILLLYKNGDAPPQRIELTIECPY